MNAGIISSRYAKAIFQYASERQEETRLHGELKMLSEQFLAVPMLKKVLDDPTISAAEKINLLFTAAGKEIGETCKQVIRLVVKNGRTHHMQNIALMYDKVYRKKKNIVVMKLTMVEPASKEIQKELVDLASKEKSEKIDFAVKTDKDVIGGFILEIDDFRLDASVKNQLNQLRLELIN